MESTRTKPRLRGVSHELAFYASLLAGAVLVLWAPAGRATLAAAIYAASLASLYGVSALYHRVNWSRAEARQWMRRLDHAVIFVAVAGTYTPICLLVLGDGHGVALLRWIWLGTALGMVQTLIWIRAPRIVSVACYAGLSSLVLLDWSEVAAGLGPAGVALIVGGCAVYLFGAIVYALRRPDPRPEVFGYHEIFHLAVIVASACHFAAIVRVMIASNTH